MFDKDWKTKATCALTQLVIRKKSCTNVFTPVFGIPQTCQLSVLGLILQDNCRFDCHVHVKLIKANKCLFILRSLRKEGYSQVELDHLFSSIVLPSITYGCRYMVLLRRS